MEEKIFIVMYDFYHETNLENEKSEIYFKTKDKEKEKKVLYEKLKEELQEYENIINNHLTLKEIKEEIGVEQDNYYFDIYYHNYDYDEGKNDVVLKLITITTEEKQWR